MNSKKSDNTAIWRLKVCRMAQNGIEMTQIHLCEMCKYCTHSPNLFQPYYWCSWYGKEVRIPINKCDKKSD
ncbi:hypothetical protein [Bacteroides fragilis]|nr:hypothetical protein [Bacteroides fragilis]